jgi:hypothetical protein
MDIGGPFPGDKVRPGREADHSTHLMLRSRMSRSYTPAPLGACVTVAGQLYFIVILYIPVILNFITQSVQKQKSLQHYYFYLFDLTFKGHVLVSLSVPYNIKFVRYGFDESAAFEGSIRIERRYDLR